MGVVGLYVGVAVFLILGKCLLCWPSHTSNSSACRTYLVLPRGRFLRDRLDAPGIAHTSHLRPVWAFFLACPSLSNLYIQIRERVPYFVVCLAAIQPEIQHSSDSPRRATDIVVSSTSLRAVRPISDRSIGQQQSLLPHRASTSSSSQSCTASSSAGSVWPLVAQT